jgi:hypothetical protein
MNINFKYPFPALLGMLLVVSFFVSCEEELTTVGAGVVSSEPFTTGKAVFDVFAFNKNVEAVPTNTLTLYQLGTFNDNVYGKTEARITTQMLLPRTNPTFGVLTPTAEENAANDNNETTLPENETVKEVILFIPYLTGAAATDRDNDGVPDGLDAEPENPNNDTDGDGVSNIDEVRAGTDPQDPNSVDANRDGINDTDSVAILANNFARRIPLDSVYFNNKVYDEFKDESIVFDLKVERSTFFLRELDPNAGFQEAQTYYSSQQFSPAFVSDVLFQGTYEFSDREILIPREDDPETVDVDESLLFTKREPGIRVALDNDFFQENILDREGGSEMLSEANFTEFIRGIHFSLEAQAGADLMMLLDLTRANITMTYTYERYNANNVDNEFKDILELDFTFPLLVRSPQGSRGITVNTLINENYPPEVATRLDNGENASRVFIKGGAGTTAQINLFEPQDGGMDIINQIKANNWVINEANLVFYVDQERLNGQVIEPPRLYLYNLDNNLPLYNPQLEQVPTGGRFGSFYDGTIQRGADGRGQKYTVRITDHINNIVIRDSANAPIGLTLTSNLQDTRVGRALLTEGEKNLPISATTVPFGTVLYGPNILESDPNHDKRVKLEIFYTEID